MKTCTTHYACDCITTNVVKLEKENEALKKKLEIAKTALEFYASHNMYFYYTEMNYDQVTFIEEDEGKKARKVLKEIEGVE